MKITIPITNVINNVFRSVLHILSTILENPKCPLDDCNNAIKPPNNNTINMTHALFPKASTKIPPNSGNACVPYKTIAPIKQAKNKQISTRFVAIAPITTNKISNTLIKPSDIISSPSIFYNE